MILDLNNVTQGELLAYVKSYENCPEWKEFSIIAYLDALDILWDTFNLNTKSSSLGLSIYKRMRYFDTCSNPSIDNLKQYLIKQEELEVRCKVMCN